MENLIIKDGVYINNEGIISDWVILPCEEERDNWRLATQEEIEEYIKKQYEESIRETLR